MEPEGNCCSKVGLTSPGPLYLMRGMGEMHKLLYIVNVIGSVVVVVSVVILFQDKMTGLFLM